jgi:hypothetical protein
MHALRHPAYAERYQRQAAARQAARAHALELARGALRSTSSSASSAIMWVIWSRATVGVGVEAPRDRGVRDEVIPAVLATGVPVQVAGAD